MQNTFFNTLEPLWKSAINQTQLSGTSENESYFFDEYLGFRHKRSQGVQGVGLKILRGSRGGLLCPKGSTATFDGSYDHLREYGWSKGSNWGQAGCSVRGPKGVDGEPRGSYGVKRDVWQIPWGHRVGLMTLLIIHKAICVYTIVIQIFSADRFGHQRKCKRSSWT